MSSDMLSQQRPDLGFGLSLRREFVSDVLQQQPAVDWFELPCDNYLDADAGTLDELARIRQDYPLILHGGSLSIGGPDPIDQRYLQQIKQLSERLQCAWFSDHLCWTLPGQSHSYDLRPLPYTKEMIDHLVTRIEQVQETLGQRLLLENIPEFHRDRSKQMDEWEFVSAVAERSDSLILLDLSNIISKAIDHNFSPLDYLRQLPADRIWEVHLTPPQERQEYQGDADDATAPDSSRIWALYRETLAQTGPISTLLEPDHDIPPLEELEQGLQAARTISSQIHQS
ncbi:hypothetical protein QQ73_11735 [Candidatus Endoriftia persephone str. Guaymas]|jgi:uncharacterized protein (UPF0276 family)|nr:DUF692 domain-containing protein [Candidatus Endoriftia persephone]EGV51372.1 hypothetical protein Rifp1Sym_bl00060 [endosymbiont of Riftia pachyptila (vent Ph05)]MBA1331769.1 hypothetical protein [Candidatus Endoriftia persephone str. Guaymas]USF88582.1 DUF692 domain-containing protein [Candidatus Endoriftia persephone]